MLSFLNFCIQILFSEESAVEGKDRGQKRYITILAAKISWSKFYNF